MINFTLICKLYRVLDIPAESSSAGIPPGADPAFVMMGGEWGGGGFQDKKCTITL